MDARYLTSNRPKEVWIHDPSILLISYYKRPENHIIEAFDSFPIFAFVALSTIHPCIGAFTVGPSTQYQNERNASAARRGSSDTYHYLHCCYNHHSYGYVHRNLYRGTLQIEST